MSKDRKIPMGRNTFLPLNEATENQPYKVPDPMQPFFNFLTGMDWMRPGAYFMNFHVEGSFVTFYMPIDAKLHYEALLHAKGYECDQTKLWARQQGYPANDFYFRVGPYKMRLSIASDYRTMQKRMLETGRI